MFIKAKKRPDWQDKIPKEPAHRLTYQIALRAEPRFRNAFIGLSRALASDDSIKGIETILDRTGDINQAMAEIPFYDVEPVAEFWIEARDKLATAYRLTVEESAEENYRRLIVRVKRITKRDEIRTKHTDEYVEEQTGRLIVAINTSQREAIRLMIETGIETGRNPRVVARNVREVIGLLPREVKMVEKKRETLLRQGFPPARVEKLTEKYAKQKLKLRAERIARTEMIDAESFGRLEAWKEADRNGLLPAKTEREWISGGPPRTCPTCESLDGARAPLYGTFDGGFERPPAHPQCRCTDELVIP